MDVDQQAFAGSSIDVINSPVDAFSLDVGGYPSASTVVRTVGFDKIKNRCAFDVVEPGLKLKLNSVYLGEHLLFVMHEQPLISQLIFLKSHICPENFAFFIEWVKYIHAMASDKNGRDLLFAGCDNAEIWFGQKLPVIDMKSPIQGVLQTLQLAKIGK